MLRLTKFGSRFPQRSLRQRESRETIFRPTHGFNAGEPSQDLLPGETPASRNFVVEDDFLTPRSGLSKFGAFDLGDACLGLFEAFDIGGDPHGYAMSSGSTVATMNANTAAWSTMSYVRGNTLSADDLPSGISTDYWNAAHIYAPALNRNVLAFTNKRNLPKFAVVETSEGTYSDFTYVFSLASKAKAVANFNDRLVWLNVETAADGELPQRVVWSARGNPFDYDIISGAGFEDLLPMSGQGQHLVADGDTLVVFSSEEIWRARPRFDAFVFDFFPIHKEFGCPFPRTIVRTPAGIVFLAGDMEVYLLTGSSPPRALGPRQAGEPSRTRSHLQRTMTRPDRAWASYNAEAHAYELYYPDADSTSGYPNRALHLKLDNFSWLEQRFSHELSAGEMLRDPGDAATWDSISTAWDDYNVTWDDAGSAASTRRTFAFGSGGTAYRFRSGQTSDDGTAIDARWRSHGLGSRAEFRYDQLFEVHAEYAADSASSLGIHFTVDDGATFQSAFTTPLSASSFSNAFFPARAVGRSPQFELRVSDGGKPKIARMQALTRDAGRWQGGR